MTGIVAQNVGRTSGLIKAASGGTGGVWTLIKTLTSDGSDSDRAESPDARPEGPLEDTLQDHTVANSVSD